jgi:hypothetical protein
VSLVDSGGGGGCRERVRGGRERERATGVGGETVAWIYVKENVIVTGYRSGIEPPGCRRGTGVGGRRPGGQKLAEPGQGTAV